jgi:L-alanine-DL-glutamate epimerase-like enolase superfamily enzyme
MHALSPLWREHRFGHGPGDGDRRAAGGGLTREQLQRLLPAGAARNAVDCALWDLQARREGKTLAQLLGVALPNRVITAQTVVIGTPDQMAASAAALWQKGPSC